MLASLVLVIYWLMLTNSIDFNSSRQVFSFTTVHSVVPQWWGLATTRDNSTAYIMCTHPRQYVYILKGRSGEQLILSMFLVTKLNCHIFVYYLNEMTTILSLQNSNLIPLSCVWLWLRWSSLDLLRTKEKKTFNIFHTKMLFYHYLKMWRVCNVQIVGAKFWH